jgi:hypothetical protein
MRGLDTGLSSQSQVFHAGSQPSFLWDGKITRGAKAPPSFVLWPYLAQVSLFADQVMTSFQIVV